MPSIANMQVEMGASGITMQERTEGICAVPGKGIIKEYPDVHMANVFDEHAIIYNKDFRKQTHVGDKVRIIPVHICPVCNRYDYAVLISADEVLDEIPILCREKLQ